ncbi:MAG: type II toxin-antitoxin system HicB family antitoxin, partial [Nanoarchaeota archaeon]
MKRNASYKSENLVLSVPFVVKKTKSGYMAECLDLNIVTQGKNLKEAKINITEAINLHMKSASELGILDNE